MNYSTNIYAYGQHDIAITGKGSINGSKDSVLHSWKSKEKPDQQQLRLRGAAGLPVEQRVFGEGHYLRPCIIDTNYCDRVLFEGYTVMNSPFYINHPGRLGGNFPTVYKKLLRKNRRSFYNICSSQQSHQDVVNIYARYV